MGDPRYEIVSDNENNIVAAQDVFKNRFTYLCYELYHYPLSFYWYLVVCITWLTAGVRYYQGDDDLFTVLMILLSLMMCACLLVPIMIYCQPMLNVDSKLKFCNEIIINKPDLTTESWSIISQNMNNFMYENKYWRTPYYFYDGKSSYNCFRSVILSKYLRIPKSSTDQDSNELPTMGNSTQNATRPAEITGYFEDYDIDRYMKKATDVYNQSVDSYLKAKYPDYEL